MQVDSHRRSKNQKKQKQIETDVKYINCHPVSSIDPQDLQTTNKIKFDYKLPNHTPSGIKWIFHSKPADQYTIGLELSHNQRTDLDVDLVLFSEDLLQTLIPIEQPRRSKVAIVPNQKTEVTIIIEAISLITSLTLNVRSLGGPESPTNPASSEGLEGSEGSEGLEGEGDLELSIDLCVYSDLYEGNKKSYRNSNAISNLMKSCHRRSMIRKRNQTENLKYLYSLGDKSAYTWIRKESLEGREISIIYLDPSQPFDFISHSTKYSEGLRSQDETDSCLRQPVILIDHDLIETVRGSSRPGLSEPPTIQGRAPHEILTTQLDGRRDSEVDIVPGYYNLGPFPCFIMQDNHNTGASMRLIFELIETIRPSSFSFLSSNIAPSAPNIEAAENSIKDVFEIHLRLFRDVQKSYKTLETLKEDLMSVASVPSVTSAASLASVAAAALRAYPEDNPENFRSSSGVKAKGINVLDEDIWYEILSVSQNLLDTELHSHRYKIVTCIHLGSVRVWPDVEVLFTHLRRSGYKILYMIHFVPESIEFLERILERLNGLQIGDYIITTAPNRGMDLGGFIVQTDVLLRLKINVDTLLKFHTKSDKRWRRELFTSMAGNVATIHKNIEIIDQRDVVVIPEKHKHNARTDTHNLKILDFYKGLYNWTTPDYFGAGTIFGLPWHILRRFWLTISQHTLGQTFYLFKSHYVTNRRESYAHAWERILSGYIPHNSACLEPFLATFQIGLISKSSMSSIPSGVSVPLQPVPLILRSNKILGKLYNLGKIDYGLSHSRSHTEGQENISEDLGPHLSANYWDLLPINEDTDVIFYDSVNLDGSIKSIKSIKSKDGEGAIKVLWIRYPDTIKLSAAADAAAAAANANEAIRSYDLLLTDEKETYLACQELGISNIFLLNQKNQSYGPYLNDNPTLHNLLYNVTTMNRRLDYITIRVYCGEEIENMHHWGDYLLARNLKWEMENLGYSVIIEPTISKLGLESRDRCSVRDTDQEGEDIQKRTVIYLGGYNRYEPNPNDRNILWFYSHPSLWLHDLRQFDPYEIICVASLPMVEKLQNILDKDEDEQEQKKIIYLPQVFIYDRKDDADSTSLERSGNRYNISFIGNSRKVYRDVVRMALEGGLRLNIWGNGWEDIIPFNYQRIVKLRWVNNEKLGVVLRKSKIIINDHWPDMRDEGFVSMKTFEFMANKAFFISDKVYRIDLVSKDIVCYSDADTLVELVKTYRKLPVTDRDEKPRKLDAEQTTERLYQRYKEIYQEALVTLRSIL